MPAIEMSFEQYRAWTKYGTAVAERDYRTADQMQGQLTELFGGELASAFVDALSADYEQYLGAVVEGECASFEPESVWRKTVFMSLWLAKHDMLTPSLADRQQRALRTCGY